jgi:hypothetical protein
MKFRNIIFFVILGYVTGYCQTRTVGLFLNDTAKTYKGYTLFAPKQNTMTYLINNDGRIIHQWTASKYPPGQSVYLLENGHLLRSCMTKGKLSTGGGEGGRVEEYDWNDNLVWQMDISTDAYMQHHDIRILPNGNVIVLAVEKKTYEEVVAAGFNPNKLQPDVQKNGMMLPDCVFEIKPIYPNGGTIVWEWHVWDHLIQDYDQSKLNYGVVKDHPELIDAAGDQKILPAFWNHMNSIDYNSALDQIMLSVRGNSEVWIIDHSTTSAEVKAHTGGKKGKGGDLLYRWGNPICYRAGTSNDQKLYQQHDAEWVKSGLPGAGNITVFNNGLGRNYSTADEFTPSMDASGNYLKTTGSVFGPSDFYWSYKATPPGSLYSAAISGVYRLPNGNTMICDGTHGTFYEVTQAGSVVWKYICPVVASGILTQGDTLPNDPVREGEKYNSVFRIYKYPQDYAAFIGKTLTPGNYVEKYPTSINDEKVMKPLSIKLYQNYPNPFNPNTVINFQLPEKCFISLKIYNIMGCEVKTLLSEYRIAGEHSITWTPENIPSGIYFYKLTAGIYSDMKILIYIK